MGRMNHDKSRSFFGGRGFYIALVLCLAAIGVAGYFVLVQQAKVAEEGKDKPVVRQEEVEDVQRAQMPEADPEPVQETLEPEELLPQVCSPLDGTTVTVFSMTELMYDETMADWRTHDGVDIRAEEGDAVKTAAAGTVKEVRYDDLMASRWSSPTQTATRRSIAACSRSRRWSRARPSRPGTSSAW